MKVVALAGGVGASKFLRGLVRVVPPEDVTVIVNTGDDIVLHGLHVAPDLDTIVYSLAEAADTERGWGLAGETWRCLESMRRYGMPAWFQLGDADIATHLYRTLRLRDGATLADVTGEIARAWSLATRVLPMTNDPVENRVVVEGGADVHLQEFLIERRSADRVERAYVKGIEDAKPLDAALDALREADMIVFCPSNPVVSIGPILAVNAYRRAILHRTCPAVGVSPIVQGAPVRGPADKLMPAAGLEVSCAGAARAYEGLLDTFVIDALDAGSVPSIEALAMRCETADTMMTGLAVAVDLAARVVAAAGA